MKELSTEQKAKAYDKTLERAKRMFSEKELNYLFPELIESDDEKIRKELIEKVKETPACIGFNDKNAVLAWLEKQGESMEINPTEFDTRLQSLIGKFDSLPKEELIGSLSFWLNVVQNNGTYKDEKKSAWSEENEEIIECLNNCLDELEKENGWRFVYVNNKNVELNKIRNWLKSLKPQNHWKPTNEQMDALLFVVRHYTPNVTNKLAWNSLKTLELMYHELLSREEGYD